MAKSNKARTAAKSRRASRARAQARVTSTSPAPSPPTLDATAFRSSPLGSPVQNVVPEALTPGTRRTTDDTNQSELPATTEETSSSSGVSLETSGLPSCLNPDSRINPWEPSTYKCVDIEESYEYFDGRPARSDQRFTIDLEHGQMDHLPDVRPYLYYVGFYSSEGSNVQREIESLPPSQVEQAYVVAGRKYLMKERELGRGYFLEACDWAEYNTGPCARYPFGCCVGIENEEGNQGFESRHEIDEYEHDCCFFVLKTNVRTPLPRQDEVRVKPEDDEWDRFIQWLYEPDHHGAMQMVESRCYGWEVDDRRMVRGFKKWLILSEYY